MEFVARLCSRPDCRLRVPIERGSGLAEHCPMCGSSMTESELPWSARPASRASALPGPELELIVDNVRSVRNVGSMLRTAEGAGIRHVHLCGISPPASHPKMEKTALGAQARVAWTQHRDALVAALALRDAGVRLWVLEGGPDARSLFDLADIVGGPQAAAIALVVGHEVAGVDARIVDQADAILAIPMAGAKDSLNVSVAMGIAAYTIRHHTAGTD